MKKISIVSGCYNEADNLEEVVRRVSAVMETHPGYEWEYLLIDNCSIDQSPTILRRLAAHDRRIKVIFNSRNFGHIRSPFYGMLQVQADAVIYLASDLQDPPELIHEFLKKWEEGYKIVMGTKTESEEFPVFFFVRRAYYYVMSKLAEVELLRDATGFGLYDREVMEVIARMPEPYPYFRGMICEVGHEIARIPFLQPTRKRGISKNNFYTLYDIAMLGVTSYSKVPLRLATVAGFLMSGVSLLIGLFYFVYKLVNWDGFELGLAPLIVGLFFFGSIQLFFIGILGEYIGAIHTKVTNRPLVVEKERLNF